jgi:hypothetical protein
VSRIGVPPCSVVRIGGRDARLVFVDLTDVDAAGDGHAAVHAQQFAVITVVDFDRHAGVGRQRVVFQDPHAALAQLLEQRAGRIQRAPGVIDQVHFHAAPAGVQQQLTELRSGRVVELIAFHVDAGPRGPDCIRQRRERCRTVDQ